MSRTIWGRCALSASSSAARAAFCSSLISTSLGAWPRRTGRAAAVFRQPRGGAQVGGSKAGLLRVGQELAHRVGAARGVGDGACKRLGVVRDVLASQLIARAISPAPAREALHLRL